MGGSFVKMFSYCMWEHCKYFSYCMQVWAELNCSLTPMGVLLHHSLTVGGGIVKTFSYCRWEYSSRPWELALTSSPGHHSGIWLQRLDQLGGCRGICLQAAAVYILCFGFHCLRLSGGFPCHWRTTEKTNKYICFVSLKHIPLSIYFLYQIDKK